MNIIKDPYNCIIAGGESFSHFLLLAIRLFWGYAFFMAGLGKIENIQPVISFFTKLGLPFPEYSAHVVAWIECVGGACLFLGFASRLVAIPLAISMLIALFTAHFDVTKKLFEDPQSFINQLPFNYFLACLIVFAFGPGRFSLDGLFKRMFSKS